MFSQAKAKAKYGEVRWTESLGIVATLITLPVALLWSLATTAYAAHNKARSLKRIAGDSAQRHVLGTLNVAQMQHVAGTTLSSCEKWAARNRLPTEIDELGRDARLLWIGPKRLGRVLLFVHGGAFLLPAADFALSFCRYLQLQLEKQDIDVGLAVLNYSLVPSAVFPTPLDQARLALEFLLAAGVAPQNLQLAGDSAGANLILQLLSHALHPLPPALGVPEFAPPAPPRLRGALLISPWASLTADSASHAANDGRDLLRRATLAEWGRVVRADVPAEHRAFIEAARAPEAWFAGVERLVERVLVTAGGAECLRDDIVVFGEALKRHHARAELVVQPDGLHEDPMLDFVLNEKKVGSLTPLLVEWLAAGFTAETM
ncbi:Alpha/Beta hydrolase protein [Mycena belliarum]|uniref:Alpha/Beta hydrolase protein n=1 Tax=Mycena belliarum TaxID=1033014 RepID=A0AAD6XJY8_9AGAR|nr:Alpha/Beta hydrolase protein [Mycena belliae]